MSRPDGEVTLQSDAARSVFPGQARVGMLGKFVEPDVAAVNGHGLRVGGESNDAGAVVEFNETDFNILGEAGRFATFVEAVDLKIIFAVHGDGFAEVIDVGELVALEDVLEGAGVVLGGEQIITFGKK